MRLYKGALKIFGEFLTTPAATITEIKFVMGFCSDQSYECAYKI